VSALEESFLKLAPWIRSVSLVLLVASARAASAANPGADGGLTGLVEDTRGAPVAGAVISLFGKGVAGAGLVALSDAAGRFSLPAVPAGSYTLRALGAGHLPAAARRVTVLPNRESNFTVSLTPVGDERAAALAQAKAQEGDKDDAPSLAELRWLLRHKRRSVLETRGPEGQAEDHATTQAAPPPTRLLASLVPDLAGTVEVMANPIQADDGLEPSASFSVLRLKGRIANAGQWSLGGLVAESESSSWRMAAEFVFEPGGGHRLQAGTGYGTRPLRPFTPGPPGRGDNHSVGAAFFQDEWQLAPNVTTTVGGRFSYIGFLRNSNHFDPIASVALRRDDHTRVSATVESRTLAPGGDLLTLSTLATAPAVAFAFIDDGLRPERSAHVELAVDQSLGATTLRAVTFYEGVHHQLANSYQGTHTARSLRIFDAGDMSARGMGVSLGRRFGAVSGSVSYRFGRSSRGPATGPSPSSAALLTQDCDFHDLAGRLETSIEGTGTRVVAFYRLIHLSPDVERANGSPNTNHRFDVQLSQGLPFVGRITRADWDFLLAVRNLFYETSEGAVLDELAVASPPTRVLGGISVRF
jgi:hypothetical protein